jgi:hypothetical protein
MPHLMLCVSYRQYSKLCEAYMGKKLAIMLPYLSRRVDGKPVFRIRGILAWIQIRILGSVLKIMDQALDPDPNFISQVKIRTCFYMMYACNTIF